jgi:MFS family permease
MHVTQGQLMNLLFDDKTKTLGGNSDMALRRAYSASEWRIIPILAGLWMLSWVDRANISFAKLQMLSDLHFSETVYGFGAGLFFLGYIVFAVPTTLLQQRIGAKRIISAIAIGWGTVSIAMMFVKSPAGFYFLRFLLGVFEAGFYPGAILYLNLWFPTKRRTRNFSIFHSAAICSTVVVGLSGGFVLEHMSGLASLAGWRWMFLVQAAPTALLGCVVWLMLPDGPATASWLSEEERRLIQADIEHDGKQAFAGEHSPRPLLANATVWVLIAVYFCILTANSALSFFIPTILRDAGFGGYAAIGNAIAAICILGALGNIAFSTYASRHSDVRRYCAIASMASVASLFLLVFVWHSSRAATFMTLAIALAGTGAGVSLFWQIPVRYVKASSAALGISLINSAANLAGFLTPWLTGYVREVTGTYKSGFITAACAQAIGAAILVVVLPLVIRKHQPVVVPQAE